MINTFKMALSVPSAHYRKRIWWCIPLAIGVALIEAASFALLYLLLGAFDDPDRAVEVGLLGRIHDLVGIESTSTFLWVIGVTVVVLMLAKGACAIWLLWYQTAMLSSAEAESSSKLFEAYVHAPHTFHLETNSAVIIRNTLVSVTTVYQNVLLGLVATATEVAVILSVSAVLLITDPIVALAAGVLMVLASLVFVRSLSRYSRRLGRENQRMLKVVQQEVSEGINGVTMLQVLNRQDDASRHFDRTRHEWADYRRAIVFVSQLPRYYLELVLLLGVAAIGLGVSALSDSNAVATVGLLVAAALRMIPSLNKILSAMNRAQVGRVATKDIVDELELVRQMDDDRVLASVAEPMQFDREIELRSLSFSYAETDRPALDEVDLHITKGESIGVVGVSGSGKSTLVSILLGLLRPQAGEMCVDGRPLGPDSLPSWRDLIGYVPQSIFVADATLRRNIAFGVPDDEIDDDRVEEVLRLSLLDEFVKTLPLGIETMTGEQGVRFSGGQRQRIGIARALYPDPELLILDEATAALDGVTEASISETIESLRGKLTMVIIAHRLSTVRTCDRLVLVKDGQVECQGPFAELAATSPDFAEMLRMANLHSGALG